MTNIGCVFYKKTGQPGELTAKWCHSDDGQGTGIASGGPLEGFEGDYHIRYFDENENVQADRELRILKSAGIYKLTWFKDGKVTAEGVGMETSDGLSAGYRNLA